MATSPSTDALVRDLRANVRSLRDALEQEQARTDRLAALVLELLPPVMAQEPHQHLFGEPGVCCMVRASSLAPACREAALAAIREWQDDRLGRTG